MTSGRSVLIALVIALVIFVLTHFAPIPGSLADLMSVNGGHAILDQQPAFTTHAVYDRLNAFGEEGRRLYQRFLLTTDIVFPLGLLTFLFLFARFSAARLVSTPILPALLPIMPFVWFALDMVENLSIVALLTDYPEQNELIAANIGSVTVAKRYTLITSILLPGTVALYTTARRYLSR